MYSKSKINILYKIYADTRDDKILGQLVAECIPVVNIILARWDNLTIIERADMSQEIFFSLMKNLRLRSDENLQRYEVNPVSYMYFYIRTLSHRAYWKLLGGRCELSLDSLGALKAEQKEMSDGG